MEQWLKEDERALAREQRVYEIVDAAVRRAGFPRDFVWWSGRNELELIGDVSAEIEE